MGGAAGIVSAFQLLYSVADVLDSSVLHAYFHSGRPEKPALKRSFQQCVQYLAQLLRHAVVGGAVERLVHYCTTIQSQQSQYKACYWATRRHACPSICLLFCLQYAIAPYVEGGARTRWTVIRLQ